MTFTRNEVSETHLVFSKEEKCQGFISENLAVIGLLRGKFIVFQLSWDNENLKNFQTSFVNSCCPSDKLSRTIRIMLLL